MNACFLRLVLGALSWPGVTGAVEPRSVSGIDPHFATFSEEAQRATGAWTQVRPLTTSPGEMLQHVFPDGFGACRLRLVADHDTTGTATLTYDWPL